MVSSLDAIKSVELPVVIAVNRTHFAVRLVNGTALAADFST